MPTVILEPLMSETFHRLKLYLDSYVYNRSKGAYPHIMNFSLEGEGFETIGDPITIKVNDVLVAIVLTSTGGDFSYDLSEHIRQDTSNLIVVTYNNGQELFRQQIDTYYMYIILYLFSIEYLKSLKDIGQIKQDNFISTGVVGDEALYPQNLFVTEKDLYRSTWLSLNDKMTLPIPSDIWKQSRETTVKRSIDITERSVVVRALDILREIYSVAGVTNIFMYPFEFHKFLDLDTDHLPRIAEGDNTKLIFPKGNTKRFGYQALAITLEDEDKVIVTSTGTPIEGYHWIYVDGILDLDGTLTLHTSTEQPLPGLQEVVETTPKASVKTTIEEETEILGQAYVELLYDVSSLQDSITVEMDVGTWKEMTNTKLVTRKRLALGVATVSGDIRVSYRKYYDPRILCCVKVNESEEITQILRTWNPPNHCRSTIPEKIMGFQIFVRIDPFDESKNPVISSLYSIIPEIIPITSDYQFFISKGNRDQAPEEEISEDSIDWCTEYRGFRYAKLYL